MTNFIQRDKKRRKLFEKYEIRRVQYKSMIKDTSLPLKIRYYYVSLLNNLPRNSSITRIKNRCILTGRGKSIYRFYKLSRISFRKLASQGKLPGIIKSSW